MIIEQSSTPDTIDQTFTVRALTVLSGIVMMVSALTMTVVALTLAILMSPILMLWAWVIRRGVITQQSEKRQAGIYSAEAASVDEVVTDQPHSA